MSTKKTSSPAKPAARKRNPAKKAAPVKKSAVKMEGPQPTWLECVRAAEAKKASAIRVLDLRPVTSFADHFVLCSGGNRRQTQAVADEVTRVMKQRDELPLSFEGYNNGEWILIDYGDLVVHIFSEQSRSYYDLDRLWRDAPEVEFVRS